MQLSNVYRLEVVKEQQRLIDKQNIEFNALNSENEQLREKLMALAEKQEALENMVLAMSNNLHRDNGLVSQLE